MQDRCVISTAKRFADVGQTERCELFGDRHGHLPRPGDDAGALFRVHFRDLDFIVVRNGLLNIFYGNLTVLYGHRKIAELRASDPAINRDFNTLLHILRG